MTSTNSHELRLSEERLRLALEAAALGSWQFTLPSRELRATPQCLANHGLGPHEAPLLRADSAEDQDLAAALIRWRSSVSEA